MELCVIVSDQSISESIVTAVNSLEKNGHTVLECNAEVLKLVFQLEMRISNMDCALFLIMILIRGGL